MKVFMSYRRSDASGRAGRLRDTLVTRFGERNVFYDVSTIAPGEDFARAVDRAVEHADVVLAVIGPDWVTAAGPDGRRRLDDPDDMVRIEVRRALERHGRVVPVLVGGAALPDDDQLPDDLGPLVRRQGFELRDEHWHDDVDQLVRDLRGEHADRTPGRRPVAVATAAVAVVLAIVAVVWWSAAGGGGGDDAEVPRCTDADLAGGEPITIGDDAEAAVATDDGEYVVTVGDGSSRTADGGGWFVVLHTTLENRSTTDVYHEWWDYQALVAGNRPFDVSCYRPVADPVAMPFTSNDGWLGFAVSCPPTGRLELVLADDDGRLDVTDDPEPSDC